MKDSKSTEKSSVILTGAIPTLRSLIPEDLWWVGFKILASCLFIENEHWMVRKSTSSISILTLKLDNIPSLHMCQDRVFISARWRGTLPFYLLYRKLKLKFSLLKKISLFFSSLFFSKTKCIEINKKRRVAWKISMIFPLPWIPPLIMHKARKFRSLRLLFPSQREILHS